jgi:glycosyltransferase involved in cell wall biosynthesis
MERAKNNHLLALFFHRYRWGFQIRGDERGFFEKAKEFRHLGVRLEVLERDPSFQDGAGEQAYTSLKLTGCRIPPANPFELFVLTLFVIVIALLKKRLFHPLAIYSYNQDVENVFPGFLLGFLTGSPLVVIHHQIDPSSVETFGRSFRNKRKAGYGLLSAIWRSISPAANRFALKRASIHIALSEAAKDDAEKTLGTITCVVVGNGIDGEKFRLLPIPKLYDAAFLGRIAPQKGIDILLKAWCSVVTVIPDARLVLIGGGDESNLQKYRAMMSDLGIEKNVWMAGFQPDEKVVELLNSSKLFVFPSRKEGFAQAVSQAMACGMCCVLSDIPALREYYGRSAVLVPAEDSTRLADAIIELLSNEKRQEELRKNARETVIGLSWNDTARRELDLIQEFWQGRTSDSKVESLHRDALTSIRSSLPEIDFH